MIRRIPNWYRRRYVIEWTLCSGICLLYPYSSAHLRLRTKVSSIEYTYQIILDIVSLTFILTLVKWEEIEPEPNQFDFGPPDEIVEEAETLHAKVRGHNFMWYVKLITHHHLKYAY